MTKAIFRAISFLCVYFLAGGVGFAAGNSMVGINVVMNRPITEAILADLGSHGSIREVMYEINAVHMQTRESELPAILAESYVDAANADQERQGSPVDTVAAEDFAHGLNTWDLDAVNATDFGRGRVVAQDGEGVFVAVLDTGLLDTWRQYFPEQRIAEELGKCFQGGGGDVGNISEPPNCWEHDTDSHGTHVTSTILGYSFFGTPFNGVAPRATVIPVKVLKNGGFGWSSMIARGIVYATNLKLNQLGGAPLVINMSLGGSRLDAVEKAAVDYAVSNGAIIVAAAGNSGTAGMIFPGAYAPVISVAATGWVGQWRPGSDGNTRNWWFADDVRDRTRAADFFIAGFSSRQKAGQDLDVAAPGVSVVGPFQLQNGKASYFFLSGTSMATPHVAGVVALMAQKNPSLTAPVAEGILESSAIALPPGCRDVLTSTGATQRICWGGDATGAGMVTADAALQSTP